MIRLLNVPFARPSLYTQDLCKFVSQDCLHRTSLAAHHTDPGLHWRRPLFEVNT